MKNMKKLSCALIMFALLATSYAARAETAAERDRRMAWWREARFGMFIHWGLYAIPAGVWNGKDINTVAVMDCQSLILQPTSDAGGDSSTVSKRLEKTEEVFSRETAEATPIVFHGKRLLFGCRRPFRAKNAVADHYLYLLDLESKKEIARFGEGFSLGSAFVEGDTLHVFAAEATENDWFHDIHHLSSADLKTWRRELAIPREGNEHLLNSSVCRDEQGYLMAYESDQPVGFCFKFARSKDLRRWEKIPGLVFAGVDGKEYSACPVIRYFKPYYYVIYLHAPMPGHNGWISFLARSKDLKTWQLSPNNPILEAGPGEGHNNSDVDLIEIDGKTHIVYCTGDQATWGELRRAVYPGPMREFFESYYASDATMTEVSAAR